MNNNIVDSIEFIFSILVCFMVFVSVNKVYFVDLLRD